MLSPTVTHVGAAVESVKQILAMRMTCMRTWFWPNRGVESVWPSIQF